MIHFKNIKYDIFNICLNNILCFKNIFLSKKIVDIFIKRYFEEELISEIINEIKK